VAINLSWFAGEGRGQLRWGVTETPGSGKSFLGCRMRLKELTLLRYGSCYDRDLPSPLLCNATRGGVDYLIAYSNRNMFLPRIKTLTILLYDFEFRKSPQRYLSPESCRNLTLPYTPNPISEHGIHSLPRVMDAGPMKRTHLELRCPIDELKTLRIRALDLPSNYHDRNCPAGDSVYPPRAARL
jgi:hypothetical protein